jgi:hypothetical protein
MKSSLWISGLMVLVLISFGCKQVPKKTTASPFVTELENHLTLIDSSWTAMIKSDDNKISNLERLSKELELIDGSNVEALKEIEEYLKLLPKHRYDQITMKDSKAIDKYDSTTNEVILKIKKVSSENPNAQKYQIVNQLVSEIQAADDSVLFFRKEFDRSVDAYNFFIGKNQKELKKSYPGYDSLRRFSVFRLIP